MSKKETLGLAFITIVAIAYFVYHIAHIQEKSENIFLQDTVKIESLGDDIEEKEIMTYNDQKFPFSKLPPRIQKKIKNEQILAHHKINQILKEYIISYHLTKMTNEGKDIDPRSVEILNPVKDSKAIEEQVEAIYNQNKAKFPKGHDPEDIKRNLFVKIVSNQVEAFYNNNLSSIYLKENLTLPDYPQLPDNWFNVPTIQSYGDDNAKNHLIWIGNYDDINSQIIKEDIGQLVKKYSLHQIKISFIPYTEDLWSTSQFFNLSALCVKEAKGSNAFWRFHTTLLDYGKDLVTLDPKNIVAAEKLIHDILKTLKYSDEEIIKISSCSKDRKSDLHTSLIYSQKALEFIPERKPPMFFLNGRLLDLAGNRLFKAATQKLDMIVNPTDKTKE